MGKAVGWHRQLGYTVEIAHGHPLADSRGRVLAHRRILFDLLGPDPQPCFYCGVVLPWRKGRKVKGQPGIEVDHINADRSDNSLINLTFACPPCQTRTRRRGDHTAEARERVS